MKNRKETEILSPKMCKTSTKFFFPIYILVSVETALTCLDAAKYRYSVCENDTKEKKVGPSFVCKNATNAAIKKLTKVKKNNEIPSKYTTENEKRDKAKLKIVKKTRHSLEYVFKKAFNPLSRNIREFLDLFFFHIYPETEKCDYTF